MKKIILLILCLFILTSLCGLNKQQQVLREAVQKYENNQFQAALELFLQLESQGIVNAELFYNIGNCYYRTSNLGKAILYYKKSLKVDANFSAARQNLQLALTQTKDKQKLEEEGFLKSLWEKVISSLSLNLLAVLALIFFAAIVFTINLIILKFQGQEKTLPVFFVIILVFLLLLSLMFSYIKWQRYTDESQAVLLTDSAIGYSGPDSDFTRVFTIHEGMIFQIEQQQEDWSLIKLQNGLGGWIRNSNFQKILLAK
jgi:tetratricopeptide (TPR) repeat protein